MECESLLEPATDRHQMVNCVLNGLAFYFSAQLRLIMESTGKEP